MSHERWQELTAPYALGMLDGDERAGFEAHLADCSICRGEVQSFNETVGALAHMTPVLEPPDTLRQRILREARATRRSRRGMFIWPVAAAASLLLALGAGYLWVRTEWENGSLRVALENARMEGMQSQTALMARDSLIDALTGAEVRTGVLRASGRPPSARVYWNPRTRVVVLSVSELSRAPAGRTYQLWGIEPGNAPVSLGTFDTQGGVQRVLLRAPDDVAFSVAAITEEPAGGSPQPTTTPFLVGNIGE